MTSARTQAALAAALANPQLVEAWQAGTARRFAAISGVDLDTLRRFGGLSYKVRHNGLRRGMPVSFRLLRLLGIELDLFAAYAAARARDGTTLATGDRLRRRDLVAFVGGWRMPGVAAHDRVWDIVRHESALADLEDEPGDAASARPERPLTSDSRLAVVGRLIRHDITYDPDTIAAATAATDALALLDALPPAPSSLGYWQSAPQARIACLRLDAFSASVLDSIDGVRTLDAISRILLGCTASPVFLAMAGELVALGIVADVRGDGANGDRANGEGAA